MTNFLDLKGNLSGKLTSALDQLRRVTSTPPGHHLAVPDIPGESSGGGG
jgi:hypothetical protein